MLSSHLSYYLLTSLLPALAHPAAAALHIHPEAIPAVLTPALPGGNNINNQDALSPPPSSSSARSEDVELELVSTRSHALGYKQRTMTTPDYCIIR